MTGAAGCSLTESLLAYAACLKELRRDLDRHGVQGPLERCIGFFMGFRRVLGVEDAKFLAKYGLLADLERVTGVDLWSARRAGAPYAAILCGAAGAILDAVDEASRRLTPAGARRLVRHILDSAYEHYLAEEERGRVDRAAECAYRRYLEEEGRGWEALGQGG